MGLGGSLLVKVAALAAVSASSFKCLEKRLTVGANCERVLRVVSGRPFQREFHGSCFFRK